MHWCDLMEFTTGHRIVRLSARMAQAFPQRRLGSDLVDGPDASYSFDQEVPETLWIGTLSQNLVVLRGTQEFGKAASTYSRLPAGQPQSYQDAFNAYISDVDDGIEGTLPDGLPLFDDGLRAAVLTQAVVDASASQTWVEVPADALS